MGMMIFYTNVVARSIHLLISRKLLRRTQGLALARARCRLTRFSPLYFPARTDISDAIFCGEMPLGQYLRIYFDRNNHYDAKILLDYILLIHIVTMYS